MTPQTIAILTNPEVIAVDQDRLGVQGRRVWQEGPLEVWMKPLADGSKSVSPFNRGNGPGKVTVRFAEVGLGNSAALRDLWSHKDLGVFQTRFSAEVPQHGVAMVKAH